MLRRARVAIVQFSHESDDPAENLGHVRAWVERLKDRDLVVFPELTLHGHKHAHEPAAMHRKLLAATPDEEVAALHDLIGRSRASVVFGALVQRGDKLLNLAIYADGERRVEYAKTHVHWSETFSPGTEFPVAQTPLGPLGMLVCFDAAFPEVPRMLALQGARVIVNISAIPAEFPLAVVHRRLQACSVENQVWTLFANRRGPGYMGGSAIVDPLGEVYAHAGEHDPILEATIDLGVVEEWRKREPTFEHRRPSLYGMISKSASESQTPK